MIGKSPSVSLPSDALPYRRLLISPVQISAILGDPGGLSSIWHSAMKYLPLFSALLGLLAVVLAVVSVASGIVGP